MGFDGVARRNDAIGIAMQQMDAAGRVRPLWWRRKPPGHRHDTARHGLCFLRRLERHDRALRKADQRRVRSVAPAVVPPPGSGLDEARHGGGHAVGAVVLGHAAHREPLPALPEIGRIGRLHAHGPGIGMPGRDVIADASQVLGIRAHTVEEQEERGGTRFDGIGLLEEEITNQGS